MEQEIVKILLGVLSGIIIWLLKDVFRSLKELKQFDIDNKDKIKDNFFRVDVVKEEVMIIKKNLKEHDVRIDKHDVILDRIVTTHNNIKCAKDNPINIS
jgi:hypothetical protein